MNKALIVKVSVLCLVCCFITGFFVYAATPSLIQTIGLGPYPGGPSYTIYVVSGTYYARDQNGANEFSGTNASALLQSCVDSASVNKIHVTAGTYDIDNTVTIDKRLIFEGVGELTIFDVAANITCFNVTDQATLRDFRIDTQNNDLSTDINSIGIWLHSLSAFYIENVYITRVGVGIHLYEVNGGAVYHLKTYNCYYSLYFTGSGSGYTAYMAQWTAFHGAHLELNRQAVMKVEYAAYIAFYGSYLVAGYNPIVLESFKNLLFDQCSFENSVYSDNDYIITMDTDDADYRLKLMIKNGGFDCYGQTLGVGLDGINAYNVTGISIIDTTIANVRSGRTFLTVSSCSQVEVLRPRIFNLAGDLFSGNGIYYYYERNSGTATISAATSVTFNHYLSGTPNATYVSWEDLGYDDWAWNASSTQITVSVTSSGTYDLSWTAEYNPATNYAIP